MHADVSHQPSKRVIQATDAESTRTGRLVQVLQSNHPAAASHTNASFASSSSSRFQTEANRPKPAEPLLSFYLQGWRKEASSDSRTSTAAFPNVYRSSSTGLGATVGKDGPSNCGPKPVMTANTSIIKAALFHQLQTSWGR